MKLPHSRYPRGTITVTTHADQRGLTFDVMLEEFGLRSDALTRLASIVRGADTDRLDVAPQAAGLLAASLGLSRMYRDDLAPRRRHGPL